MIVGRSNLLLLLGSCVAFYHIGGAGAVQPPISEAELQAARERPPPGPATAEENELIDSEEPTRAKNYISNTARRWPSNLVPYEIGDSITSQAHRDVIAQAMTNIMDNTCIVFQERNGESGYVEIDRRVNQTGCWSYVGYFNSRRQLNLGTDGCFTNRVVVHELLHALGSQHEHVRPDRNNKVNILWDNIPEDKKHNFNRESWEGVAESSGCSTNANGFFDCLSGNQVVRDGFAYDFDSIMHYFDTAFGIGGAVTIEPVDPADAGFGSASQLSALDIAKLNCAYQCSADACPDVVTTTTTEEPAVTILQPNSDVHTFGSGGECVDIMSPNYAAGGLYGKKEKLGWTFKGSCSSFTVSFASPFEILGFVKNGKCKQDSLVVYPGKRKEGKFDKKKNGAANLCGTSVPSDITLTNEYGTSNQVYLKTSNKDHGRGFRATVCMVCG